MCGCVDVHGCVDVDVRVERCHSLRLQGAVVVNGWVHTEGCIGQFLSDLSCTVPILG